MDWYNSLEGLIIKFVESGGISTSIGFVLTFWGCYIALRGLNTWRQQVIEQPKIELARDIVESFHNIKDLIQSARRSYLSYSPDEVKKYYENNELTKDQCGVLYRLMILDRGIDQIQTFQRLRNKAKVLYSKDVESCFLEINQIINLFQSACLDISNMYKNHCDDYLTKEDKKRLFARIHYQGEEDETNSTLQKIIKEVEYNLKPFYKSKTIKWKKLKHKKKDKKDDK